MLLFCFLTTSCHAGTKNFCTVADARFYPWLCDLIGSIHETNAQELGSIAVFDLGLTEQQKNELATMVGVSVHSIEKTHPDLFKEFTTTSGGKKARGWYAWKAVVLKQALEMFDAVLYLDAGTIVRKPLDNLFTSIREKGYFIVQDQKWWMTVVSPDGTRQPKEIQFVIGQQATRGAREHFDLVSSLNSWVLSQPGIVAGVQGVSRKVFKSYVLPMYERSKKLELFADDGSAPLGFGLARHDQTLFSIAVRLLGFTCVMPHKQVMIGGASFLIGDDINEDPAILYASKGRYQKRELVRRL